ncbi:hypothetical protein BDW74DRAFT_175221 [Aspergillus multicolor]|uniref:uncharacterized protein n=1 Tax=Aspergillus multicolor TaxID=41759 RepID=UPI003CCC936F
MVTTNRPTQDVLVGPIGALRPTAGSSGTATSEGAVYAQIEELMGTASWGQNKPAHIRQRPVSKEHFPSAAVEMLESWYYGRPNGPYPDIQDLRELHRQTRLGIDQISRWFTREQRRNHGNPMALPARAVQVLGSWYNRNPYPSAADREKIRAETGLRPGQIWRWFMRERKRNHVDFWDLPATAVEVLKSCYNRNPNPSGEDKERIEEETGLDMLQINGWFERVRGNPPLRIRAHRHLATAVRVLAAWFLDRKDDPEKERLAEETGLTLKQVRIWFEDARRKRGYANRVHALQVARTEASNCNSNPAAAQGNVSTRLTPSDDNVVMLDSEPDINDWGFSDDAEVEAHVEDLDAPSLAAEPLDMPPDDCTCRGSDGTEANRANPLQGGIHMPKTSPIRADKLEAHTARPTPSASWGTSELQATRPRAGSIQSRLPVHPRGSNNPLEGQEKAAAQALQMLVECAALNTLAGGTPHPHGQPITCSAVVNTPAMSQPTPLQPTPDCPEKVKLTRQLSDALEQIGRLQATVQGQVEELDRGRQRTEQSGQIQKGLMDKARLDSSQMQQYAEQLDTCKATLRATVGQNNELHAQLQAAQERIRSMEEDIANLIGAHRRFYLEK